MELGSRLDWELSHACYKIFVVMEESTRQSLPDLNFNHLYEPGALASEFHFFIFDKYGN